jgi:NAD(P)H-dependent FMN reductase
LKEHTKKWAAKITSVDGFVFVTPEYNHGPSGALKNAIDFLYSEWNKTPLALSDRAAQAAYGPWSSCG